MVDARQGDCLDVMATLDACSIDACVTDPPYGLAFMGKAWDHGVPGPTYWRSVLRVLKPGAHLVAFGGTRTYHRLVCAIEDAGFEVRDQLAWLYGSGFPKSHNLPDGWGTALKPAFEPIVLARKPLSEGTVAANVLRWRTGALNIDACRIETRENQSRLRGSFPHSDDAWGNGRPNEVSKSHPSGRWPANVCHDGSDEVVGAFPTTNSGYSDGTKNGIQQNTFGKFGGGKFAETYGDSGSAARFFYSAKASKADRAGSKHPTVKPIKPLRWLIRLVTPIGGIVLDPFAGSGTTGEAAAEEGFRSLLIEREPEYHTDIVRRAAGVEARKAECLF